MLEKLEGIEFTTTDLEKAKDVANKCGQFTKNKQFFEDCAFALAVVNGRNKNASFVRQHIKNHPKLTGKHKKAIEKLIADEDIYNADSKQYPTIKAMQNAYGL